MTTLSQTAIDLSRQFEGTRLALAAYAAEQLKALLATNPSTANLVTGAKAALISQGFTDAQATSFLNKYTPVAALDKDGAGAVLFRINGTEQIAVGVRGTDNKTDLFLADIGISAGVLPAYQTVLIANFVLRETTPVGQTVNQFELQGINGNLASVLTNNGSMPLVQSTGQVAGTGRALGTCVDAAAHSEGSPEVTVLGSAVAQCQRITTINGPGVEPAQMQGLANQITNGAGRPAVDITNQNQLNVGTTGLSIIDGLNGGLPGDTTTLTIPTTYGGLIGSHSVIVAMNAAEGLYKASLPDSGIQTAPPPTGLGTTRNSAVLINSGGAGSHSATFNAGGGVDDLWVVETNKGNTNMTRDEFRAAFMVCNPAVTNIGSVQQSTPYFIPQKVGDVATYNYAGGASVSVNSKTDEYYMIVPDGTGDTTTYSRQKNATGGFDVSEIKLDSAGEELYKFKGTQASADADIVPVSVVSNQDNNHDGKLESSTIGIDRNHDGIISQNETVTTGGAASQVSKDEAWLKQQLKEGRITQTEYNDFTAVNTATMVASGLVSTTGGGVNISPPLNQQPIGAFYESVTPANDLALSIAAKTPVILDGNNNALTAAQLAARDVNSDGKLSGTELNNLKVWIDQSEDGIATNTAASTTELTTLASYLAAQGFSSIRNTDYAFYTKGNAKFIDALQATASAPSSGIDALRNTNNHRTISTGYIIDYYLQVPGGSVVPIGHNGETSWKDWTSNEVKQSNDDTTLVGTSGNDNFGANYYSGVSWLPSGNIVNLMAGAGDDVVFGSTRNDNLWGGTGNDDLLGDAGNDKIYGEEGNDRLFGGVGDDLMLGGEGNDLLLGFNPSNWDQTLPSGQTDNDTMYGGNGDDAILGQLGDDKLFGEAGNDEIQGGDGNDQIYGGDGNDRMFGGSGDDLIYGGAGDDVIVGFNPTNWDQTLLPGQTDNNTLYGGAGNDVILGGVGNDYIDGGAGADYMQGGKGDDTYIVNSVNDTILEQLGEGYDTVISSSNYILNFGIEELRLLAGYDINATGNSLDNKLIGNERDNIIDGVTGADVMRGGLGNDTYYVDNAGDQVIEQQNEGTDRVQSSISYTLGQNIENLVLLDFSKPEHGLVDGTPILVYGYPKANELDYMQGNAPQGYKGTCALTSISNLMTQAKLPTTEEQVVQVAIDHHWAVTTQDTTDPARLGGSNYLQQQAILASFNIRNDLLAGYNAEAIANLIQGGRGVIVAVNAGQLWSDANYTNSEVGEGGINHVVTVTGAASPRAAQTMGVGCRERSAAKRSVESRHLTPIGLRLCAKQRQTSNRALLARPSGDCLAGHDALEAANDMAWRTAA